MPNAIPILVEERIVAFALGHPGFGPARISAELARPLWGGLRVSQNGVWRVLKRHGINTRAKRLGLIAGSAVPPEPAEREDQRVHHIDAEHPGELVQLDCFYIGRLTGTKGAVWQYTAIDVASAFVWADLYVTPKNPLAHYTSALAARVAQDLAARGWKLETILTDNGSEFRSRQFTRTIVDLGGRHRFIHAGRPQSNGCVERVQRTILEECWKPAFARYLIPKYTGLRRDLDAYVLYYNTDRAHTGRWNQGRTPEDVIGKAKIYA
jgi:transposase InsO family protein